MLRRALALGVGSGPLRRSMGTYGRGEARRVQAGAKKENGSEERAGTTTTRGDQILSSGTLRFKHARAGGTDALGGGEEPSSSSSSSSSSDCCEIVLGIDPDRNGAIAILRSTRVDDGEAGCRLEVRAEVIDVPVYKVAIGKTSKGRERIDAAQLAQLIKRLDFPKHKTVAFLEGGGVEYHFSSYSAFVQGVGVGIWEGVLSHAEIPWHKINSKTWKTLFELVGSRKKKTENDDGGDGAEGDGAKKKRASRGTKVKSSSVALARQIFPELEEELLPKGKHGRADALLIASYGHLVRAQEEGLQSSLKDVFVEAGLKGLSSEKLKLDLLTANELKVLLKDRGLKVSGKKGELIERLLEHGGEKE
ncbi:SAP domain-containing protein [Chloropicon primus]|uniref:SAP domain-containing protein n=1 Tax=Chloropicon primus TaxID=1764295 RepID=A0A5B8MHD2_9CHLO|nr:hypothetical protein A3770_03p23710 [Chloropicon primus]UPQ99064.1 SAP domain-containing protein [Chloropicon primus]|eukprot:QDZ19853.1 hypothetical protein A3770_03p23710 [Chloropicon primus]